MDVIADPARLRQHETGCSSGLRGIGRKGVATGPFEVFRVDGDAQNMRSGVSQARGYFVLAAEEETHGPFRSDWK